MPYEPVPTQIQMAPLNMLPGLRLKTSHLRDRIAGRVRKYTSGLGQYVTFSTPGGDYQLTQNGQLFDPSGNVVGTLSPGTSSAAGGSYQTISTPAGDYQLVGNTLFAPSGQIVGTSSGASSFGGFLQQNAPLLLGGVAALFLFAAISGGRR